MPRREQAARRRLRRIRLRDTWPLRMWLLLIAVILAVLLAPRVIDLHRHIHHRHGSQR